jgi:SAM-dependent methyltransferase
MMGNVRDHAVLDLGSGAGFYTRRFVEQAPKRVTAVDISDKMLLQFDGPPIETIVGDAMTVDILGKFDRILCAGVLEFVPDSIRVLENAHRHAAENARLVILAPRQNWIGRLYRKFHRSHGLNIRLFTIAELTSITADAGWQIASYSFVFPFSWVLRCDSLDNGITV